MPRIDERTRGALEAIRSVVGTDEANEIEQSLTTLTAGTYSDLISLGRRGLVHRDQETRRRKKVRAILLAGLVRKKLHAPHVPAQKTTLLNETETALDRRLKGLFPFKPFGGRFANRTFWAPENFSDPENHNDNNFRYIIHGIAGAPSRVAEAMRGNASEEETYRKVLNQYARDLTVEDTRNPLKKNLNIKFYKQYLENPDIMKTIIISATVIDTDHRAAYYPFGFILKVPPECVYSTFPSDQGVKNRTNQIIGELSRVHEFAGKILTPAEVLQGTTGKNGDTGYNEIVLVGTAPEGKQVSVNGLYVKTDALGRLFVRNSANAKDKTPYVNDELRGLINTCSRTFDLPICFISDTSSGASTQYWY